MARRESAPRQPARAAKTRTKARARGATVKSTKNGAVEASRRKRARQVIALIDEWLADESGYDERNWPKLKQAIDEDRLSDRQLFDG